MANRTTIYAGTDGVAADVMSDERTVSTLSDNNAAKVQYIAEIDGTPDSSNIAVVYSDGSKKVDGPTLTKGTQGTRGLTVQDLKDAGRVSAVLLVDEYVTTAAADTLINTLSSSKANAAPTTGLTSYSVVSGKTFRLQALMFQITTTTGNTTGVKCTVRMRVNAGGACAVTSPVVFSWSVASSTTALGASAAGVITIPDGFEIAAGSGIGFTVIIPGWTATTAAPLVIVNCLGYEY